MIARTFAPSALIAALALAACGDDSTAVDYTDPAPETPARTDCLEDDFEGMPLMGPGFTDGAYTGPTDAPLVASSTVIYLLPGAEAGARFEALMEDIRVTLPASDGLVGFALGGSQRCGAYRTLTLWRDMSSMMGFVGSDAHIAAMSATPEVADVGTRTVHWTLDPASEALTWDLGKQRAAGADDIGGLGGR